MGARTYGRVDYGTGPNGASMYRVTAVPHVAAQLKRVFPRADKSRPGIIFMNDTREVARDLEWFMQRWPLQAGPATLEHLTALADEHRATEQAVAAILDGYRPPDAFRAPAVEPREYQWQADAMVAATGRLLLADDVGLGKTLASAIRLRDPDALPALVVCPVHLCTQWQREISRTLPWLHSHIVAKGTPYDPSATRASRGRQPDVLITSYAKLPGWADHLAGDIRTVIFDEVHELRTGTGTNKGTAAATVAWKARYRTGCSATPVFNYGGEIWNIIHILDPDALGTADEFTREWCGAPAGMARHNLVKDPAMLGGYLRDAGLMLCRTRKELHRELPEPIQVEQPVDTDHASITEVAEQVAEQARILTGEIPADFKERGQAALEIDWRLRQVTGVAKAPYVAEFIRLLLESEERVVVWAWHRAVYELLAEKLAHYKPVLYTGSESPAQKQANADAFCGGASRVLLMSLRSGAGLDGLQEHCSVGVFAELDWSPEQHAQCVGRLARDGQDKTVVAYYMTSDDGTDPVMCEVLGIKKQQALPIRQPDMPLFAALTDSAERARRLAADVLSRIAKRQGVHSA